MKKTLIALILSASLPLTATASDSAKWSPRIDFEGKLGNERSLGEADLLIPLWQDNDRLFFANLRGRLDNNDSYEGNAGIGLRQMLGNGWNVGGYGYFDRRKSPYDNFFNQVTIGVEALSMDWDLRANAYIPVGDTRYYESSLDAVDFSGTTITYRAGEERAMQGYDAEVGWRIPVFSPEANKHLRIYAGGYRFTDSKAETIQGPRARLEMKFNALPFLSSGSRLSLGLEYQHDDPRGSQSFAVLRLSIPLGGSKAKVGRRLSPMEQRMTDPIVRDVDIVSQGGSFGSAERITETADGDTITLLDSSTISNGADFAAAINAAGPNSTVILNGSYTNIDQLSVLQNGQSIVGAADLNVKTPSGRTVTITTPSASVIGTGSNGGSGFRRFFDMADNSSLIGIEAHINHSISSTIVRTDGKQNVQILNNTFSSMSSNTASGIQVDDSHNVTIRNNHFNIIANGVDGHGISFQGTNSNIDISNNSIILQGTTADHKYTYFLAGGVTINNLSGTGNTANTARCYGVGGYTVTGSIETNGNSYCPP
jgi:Inverse autotransporter, beta-domain